MLLPFEDEIRKLVQNKVTRGHVVVVIQQDRDIASSSVEIDEVLLRTYLKIVEELKKKHSIRGTLNINTLLSLQGLVKVSQPTAASRVIFKKFKPILEEALRNFVAMKKKEGDHIARDILKSIHIVERNINRVEALIPQRNSGYKSRLLEVMEQYKKDLNEERFYQELLYAVDRTDVTEECKRLFSHLKLFKEALNKERNPGRKLNFLLQEMQREANTCSVKANFLKISKAVVQIKEEIEKIREQVQNIE